MNKLLTFFSLTICLLLMSSTTVQGYVGVGDAAPDFTVVSVDGDTINLSDYAGQPVLLNFLHYN